MSYLSLIKLNNANNMFFIHIKDTKIPIHTKTKLNNLIFNIFSSFDYCFWFICDSNYSQVLIKEDVKIRKNCSNTNLIVSFDCGFVVFEFFLKKVKVVKNKKLLILKHLHAILNEKTNGYIFYYEQSYWRLTKFTPRKSDYKLNTLQWIAEKNIDKALNLHPDIVDEEEKMFGNDLTEILICYDCETISVKNIQQPYMLAMYICNNKLVLNEQEMEMFDGIYEKDKWHIIENKNVFEQENYIADCFAEFISTLTKNINITFEMHDDLLVSRPIVRIFGFNNYKFDDHFVMHALRKLRGVSSTINLRNNKITSQYYLINNIIVYFNDIITWIPDKTLAQACEDFKLETAKMPVNILSFNKYCQEQNKIVDVIDKNQLNNFLVEGCSFSVKRDLQKKYTNGNVVNIYKLILDYCKFDVKATFELYKKIFLSTRELILLVRKETGAIIGSTNCFNYISPSQLSGSILLAYIHQKFPQMKWLKIQSTNLAKFICNSYFGGRVDFGIVGEYSAAYENKIAYYDVTSEYTLVMTGYFPYIEDLEKDVLLGNDFPLELVQNFIDKCLNARNEMVKNKQLISPLIFKPIDISWKAIFLCDIFKPEDETNLISFAPIPARTRENLIYHNCNQENRILNSSHLKNLIMAGFNVKVKHCEYNIFFAKQKQIFLPFVDTIGKLKADYKDVNKSLSKLLKLILNSAAGKLAQKPKDETTEFNSFAHFSPIQNYNIESEHLKNDNWSKSRHYLASFITAEANHIIFKAAYTVCYQYVVDKIPIEQRCPIVLYTDTDSITIDTSLIENSKYPYHFELDKEIGRWNDTKNDYDVTWGNKFTNQINKIVVLAKKSYVLFNNKNNVLTLHLKGIHKEQMKIFYNLENLKKIIRGEPFKIEFDGLLREKIQHDNELVEVKNLKDPLKLIKDGIIKKTLSRVSLSNFKIINCTNENFLKSNINNDVFVIMPIEDNFVSYSSDLVHDNFLFNLKNETNN